MQGAYFSTANLQVIYGMTANSDQWCDWRSVGLLLCCCEQRADNDTKGNKHFVTHSTAWHGMDKLKERGTIAIYQTFKRRGQQLSNCVWIQPKVFEKNSKVLRVLFHFWYSVLKRISYFTNIDQNTSDIFSNDIVVILSPSHNVGWTLSTPYKHMVSSYWSRLRSLVSFACSFSGMFSISG